MKKFKFFKSKEESEPALVDSHEEFFNRRNNPDTVTVHPTEHTIISKNRDAVSPFIGPCISIASSYKGKRTLSHIYHIGSHRGDPEGIQDKEELNSQLDWHRQNVNPKAKILVVGGNKKSEDKVSHVIQTLKDHGHEDIQTDINGSMHRHLYFHSSGHADVLSAHGEIGAKRFNLR